MQKTMMDSIPISSRARALWAKTGGAEERNLWSPLYVHMADSAGVARKLWNEWLAESVKHQIVNAFGCDDSATAALVTWLAGIHDIGKATPGFQYKVSERAELVEQAGLQVPSPRMMNHPPSHAFMSEVILEDWLDGRGWDCSWTFGCILGTHHGTTPSSDSVLDDITSASRNFPNENLGDDDWRAVQEELLGWMFEESGMAKFESVFSSSPVPQPEQALVSALVIVADWIASNSDLFPLDSCIGSYDEFIKRTDAAWASLALPSAWQAMPVKEEGQELFHHRFIGLPEDASLRPAQEQAMQAASDMDGAGLLIIEAPMGNGKTEAALMCSEIMAPKTGAGGIAYLLPTMATSNAMFKRVKDWLECVPDSRGRSTQSMQLLHSKAALNPDYDSLRSWGRTWMGDDAKKSVEEDVTAHQWFGGRKRGLLSSFVVGTVDQLLMAALKARHVQLRHLGLAGKVVIIDEVHAYDAYMNVYLDRVLTWLGAYGVPTILLSATLPAERRNELIRAYRGRDRKSTRRASKRKDIPEAPRKASGLPSYPLVTTATRNGALDDSMYRACDGPSIGTNVIVERLEDDDATLVAQLEDLLSDGGCACVLRDTVSRAQSSYERLKTAFGDSCVKLVHSRFIAVDRMENDAELLRLLGPDPADRPSKLIVVGTQVIEQSLDIDFDVMITDIAPIDLLLQRMGRLHRHERGENQRQRPEKLRQARCFITGIEDWATAPPKVNRGIEKVYHPAMLLRSLLSLRAKSTDEGTAMVNLPHDIAGLVEQTYSRSITAEDLCDAGAAPEWVHALQGAEEELEKTKENKQLKANAWLLSKPQKGTQSLIGWLNETFSLTDETKARAAVRDSGDTVEVIAVQVSNDGFTLLPWVTDIKGGHPCQGYLGDGSEAPDDEVARLAASCTVSLPFWLSSEQVIDALEIKSQALRWQESRWLQGQLVLAFDSNLDTVIETKDAIYHMHYSRKAGLELVGTVRKKGDAQ